VGGRLVLLPGLGADADLLEPQRRAFPDLEVLPWLDPRPDESLDEFGRRMAEASTLDGGSVIGGVSFGGMVASVMARHVRPRALVLIASCTSGRAVRGYRRVLAPLLASFPWKRPLPRAAWPLVAWFFGARAPHHRKALYRLLAQAPIPFVQWGLSAIVRWSPATAASAAGTRVRHIHGTSDRLLPIRGVHPTDVVQGGGHFINVTHADQVNECVQRAREEG
jgi:pimeloyl-ACP methyl ester carboxylesterase